ncbi:DUF2225 domain-containing protein [Falsibacillus pallidus]|uniref:DUF2225 domain-containing protein n=1 Tax=Falsibacillus pallidus TaxID=493781 RepID=A0A370GED7_9BACI|nr:DUF2225 domain-containing protein [Falsibacillus pallidus]RDI41469.1 hypothetical protein DFR59_108120 [Falsibacillus pallidus]
MSEVTPFFERKLECPLCKHSFKTTKIRSRFIKIERHDSDFCPVYNDESVNPLLYNVHVCPSCGYSYTDEFQTFFVPLIREELEEKVAKHWTPQDFGGKRTIAKAVNAYKLAIYCGMIRREKKVTIAGLYLRIAWLYRLASMHAEEARFMKLSALEYSESYSNDDFSGTQMSEVRILYMIAELQRRLGNRDAAVLYFSKIIEKQQSTMDRKVVDMARERWQEMRETMKTAL